MTNTNALENFQHVFIDNQAEKTLFLLHGTGGNERDLLPLVESLSDKYNFVGLLGNVRENGMPRFFEREALGVFNQASIRAETKKLADFFRVWCQTNQVNREDTAWLGYSNGANLILALAFLYPSAVSQAVLLHPMLPFKPAGLKLVEQSFLVSYGAHDRMISAEDSKQVIETLKKARAIVETVAHEGGHEIRPNEIQALTSFLNQ